MTTDFNEVMSQRTDDELITIITVDRIKYQPQAIRAAEIEVEKRKIDPQIINQRIKKFKLETAVKERIKSRSTSFQNRVINQIIDFIVIVFLIQILNKLISLLFNPTGDMGFITFIISYFGYYIYMENKYQQTLGKFFTKTKVVKYNGDKPKLINIVGRTFLRTIPYDVISFFLDGNLFHDINSKTMVINLNKKLGHL
jgi:uncharacterized RDD family membrane protein YckC